MSIGTEEEARQVGWAESFENRVIGMVDSMLPPTPELDGYMTQPENKASTPKAASRENASMSGRRQALGDIDDATYIILLECELNTSECEISAWKRRTKELEEEVARLKGLDADDSSADSDASTQEVGESEIEWETRVPEEGILIDIEGTAGTKAERKTPAAEADREESGAKEGVLIDVGASATKKEKYTPVESNGSEEGVVLHNWQGATVWYSLSDASPTVGEVGEVEEVVINNEVSNRIMADDGNAQSGTSSGSDDSEAGETPQEESSDDESEEGPKEGILINLQDANDATKGSPPQSTTPVTSEDENQTASTPRAGDCDTASEKAEDTGDEGVGTSRETADDDSEESDTSGEDDSDEESEEGPKEGILIELLGENGAANDSTKGPPPQSTTSVVSNDDDQSSSSEDGEERSSDSEPESDVEEGPREGILLDLTETGNFDIPKSYHDAGPLVNGNDEESKLEAVLISAELEIHVQ
jgi:hypothetical protein